MYLSGRGLGGGPRRRARRARRRQLRCRVIQVREELPYTDTGKLLRRVLEAELTDAFGSRP
jgi:acyl-coenzyme A synthetase/AMP-(fatty) acid ligase